MFRTCRKAMRALRARRARSRFAGTATLTSRRLHRIGVRLHGPSNARAPRTATGRRGRMRTTKLCHALMLASGGVLLGAGPAALAQTTAAPATQTLERVEVTGSNIRRINSETASPVTTVTREEIQKSSRTSVAEYLQTLAVDNQGSVPKTSGAGFASGASGISLRGLGAASTLVLLNGRRIAPYGLADDGQKVFADLNLIPLDAVDRIEILKDGGSAIYGSDAIAGVVNVILRRDYRGLSANVSFGTSEYWNAKEKRASLTGGFGDLQTQGFNVLANFEVGRQ